MATLRIDNDLIKHYPCEPANRRLLPGSNDRLEASLGEASLTRKNCSVKG